MTATRHSALSRSACDETVYSGMTHTHIPIDVLGSRSLAIGVVGWLSLPFTRGAYENEGKPEKAVAWSMISRGASPPKPPVG